jgi:hypothetical protein
MQLIIVIFRIKEIKHPSQQTTIIKFLSALVKCACISPIINHLMLKTERAVSNQEPVKPSSWLAALMNVAVIK